jgi:23S rRNA (pseudouridine1915-N3)-methyltransferase
MTGKPALTVLCVGKLREGFWRDAEAEYRKRLTRYTTQIEVVEVSEEPTPENAREREGERLLTRLPERACVVALDSQGKSLDSVEFAVWLDRKLAEGVASEFVFVIGGSEGLSDAVRERAHLVLAFGKMTFPHQMMRVILLEQLYRAAKINRGEAYHK